MKTGKVRNEEELKVKGKRLPPRVFRQVNGSEQLKFMTERWVFIPTFGHVTTSRDRACHHVANRKIPLGWVN